MAKTAVHKRQVLDLITATGNTIKLHSADPGTTGASAIATTPASGNTTWAAAVDGSGGDAGKASATGSKVTLQVPASTTVTHYGIYNGATFLRGEALDASITVNATGPVSVDVTPRSTYE
ncbi:hypothetical protein [Gordonia sp. (in: high G+C Gram-positive bacteria)]|uniref:hypothetical protein n=1 Tax=Gordonia sp. (in: high G+C Gram-positive bacteria) TaxID=84139 RepID=UPI003C781E90